MSESKLKNNNNFINHIFSNKKIVYPAIIIISIIIIFLLVYPIIFQGKLTITTLQYPIGISYCQTYKSDKIITTNNDSGLGCKSSEMININITADSTELKLKPGTYFLKAFKTNYQTISQDFVINFQKNTILKIDLKPIGSTISNQLIHGYTYDKNNEILYFLYEEIVSDEKQKTNTQFAIDKTSKNNTTNIFKTTKFQKIEKIYWSPDFQKVIVKANEPDKSSLKYLIDIPSNTIIETKLPDQEIFWTNDSESVYYLYQDLKEDPNQTPPTNIPPGAGFRAKTIYGPNHNTITKALPDGSNWKVIYKLDNNLYDIKLSKSLDDHFFGITTSNFEGYIYDTEKNNLQKLDENILFNNLSFSPDKKFILAETVNNNYRPLLQYASMNDLIFKSLNTITFLEKTTWTNNNQFVAAIGDYIPSTSLNDILNTTDRLKLYTLDSTVFTESEWNITNQVIEGIHNLSGSQNTLFLIDKDNYLYFIPFADSK